MADIKALDHRDTAFIGHPSGLGWLSFCEFWERFSYYGMQALLVLYMTDSLLHPGHIEHVVGRDRAAVTAAGGFGVGSIHDFFNRHD